ncbi:unnamed protein product, partial [Ceratitis capitata]
TSHAAVSPQLCTHPEHNFATTLHITTLKRKVDATETGKSRTNYVNANVSATRRRRNAQKSDVNGRAKSKLN